MTTGSAGIPAPEHLEHVPHRRAGRRGDDPELARKVREGALVLRIEEPLLLKPETEPVVGEPQGAFAGRLQLLDHELEVPAGAVQPDARAREHLHAVARLEPEPHPVRAEERAADLRARVLEGEVHVSRAGPREVGQLALHPDEGEGVFEQSRDFVGEAPDGDRSRGSARCRSRVRVRRPAPVRSRGARSRCRRGRA